MASRKLLTLSNGALIVSLVFGIASIRSIAITDLCVTDTLWIIAQQLPRSAKDSVNKWLWSTWEAHTSNLDRELQQIPTIHVQNFPFEDLAGALTEQLGSNWAQHPLLLKGLWPRDELLRQARNLSLAGLLNEDLVVPYFVDARKGGTSPDGEASIKDVVSNITFHGLPHKLATQLLIQAKPSLINEVAPTDVVTELFGRYFDQANVVGSGPFNILPALTTVPLFVASGSHDATNGQPYTPLHSEPICNIAVQLSGRKAWTLVEAQHWKRLMPAVAPDGRAFVTSKTLSLSHVPRYEVTTDAGDALWLPAWTWHRVDYSHYNNTAAGSTEISIAASLFHFRLDHFTTRNPIFAAAIVPALIRELLGLGIQ